MRRALCVAVLTIAAVAVASPARGATIGILEKISPTPETYILGLGGDWLPMEASGIADVTGLIQGVDLVLPPGVPASTSGCEAADFAGFVPGRIALLQRGTCTFELKAGNAFAAGAIGVLIFNEGNTPDRMDAIFVTADSPTENIAPFDKPIAFLSFALGESLAGLSGQATIRLRIDDATGPVTNVVPEPATLSLLGVGFAAVIARRKMQRR